MSGGVSVEDDDVIKVGGDAVELLDGFVDDLDQPSQSSTAPLWHTSHSKRRVGVKYGVRGIASWCTITWWNEKARSKRENV